MKVLVVSHNVFCQTSNMGKTLSAYFHGWNCKDIAQLYVHSEIPTDNLCGNYYRITDKDAIKSILTRKSGTIFNGVETNGTSRSVESHLSATLYQKGRSRTPLIYLARNLWWKLGAWKTRKLLNWINEFEPDIIFLASGDYAFIYDIALELAKYKRIPLVVSCMDDYYFYNKNENKFLGKYVHKTFMKHVKRTMEYSDCIFAICEKMSTDYSVFFNKPCYTLHTPTSINSPLEFEKTNRIVYMGNLGYKRNEQLVRLGQALKTLECRNKPDFIDVYSTEKNPALLNELIPDNGIQFHGAISSKQVLEIMGSSLAVIHTESFDDNIKKSIAYSVSTKIADSLASGTCILAYGPQEVASIDYLRKNNAAYCITEEKNLSESLLLFLNDSRKREQAIINAEELAKQKHSSEQNYKLIRDILLMITSKN